MTEIRFKGPNIGDNLGTVSATITGVGTDSTVISSFQNPPASSGIPRLSDAFDGDIMTVDTTGLTNPSNYLFRIVGGATLQDGPADTFDTTGQGGQWIEVDVTHDGGVSTSPAVQVYAAMM